MKQLIVLSFFIVTLALAVTGDVVKVPNVKVHKNAIPAAEKTLEKKAWLEGCKKLEGPQHHIIFNDSDDESDSEELHELHTVDSIIKAINDVNNRFETSLKAKTFNEAAFAINKRHFEDHAVELAKIYIDESTKKADKKKIETACKDAFKSLVIQYLSKTA